MMKLADIRARKAKTKSAAARSTTPPRLGRPLPAGQAAEAPTDSAFQSASQLLAAARTTLAEPAPAPTLALAPASASTNVLGLTSTVRSAGSSSREGAVSLVAAGRSSSAQVEEARDPQPSRAGDSDARSSPAPPSASAPNDIQIPDWTPAAGAGRLELALHRLAVVIKAQGAASAELEPVQQAIENAVVTLASANPELAFAMTHAPEDDEIEVQHRLPKPAKGFSYLDKKTVQNLHKLFSGVDLDGSGDLNQTETTSLLKKLGMFTTEEDAHRIYREMDQDRSGDVDFEEFATAIDKELCDVKYTDNDRITLMHGFAEVRTGFAGAVTLQSLKLRST